MKLMRLLQPSEREIERLALRETDPDRYEHYRPIERGPLVAVGVLVFVAVAAVVVSPLRLIFRLLRGGDD